MSLPLADLGTVVLVILLFVLSTYYSEFDEVNTPGSVAQHYKALSL